LSEFVLKVFCKLCDLANCKILLIHVHLGLKLGTLMPEGGWGGLKHVACSVECNKFVVFHRNK